MNKNPFATAAYTPQQPPLPPGPPPPQPTQTDYSAYWASALAAQAQSAATGAYTAQWNASQPAQQAAAAAAAAAAARPADQAQLYANYGYGANWQQQQHRQQAQQQPHFQPPPPVVQPPPPPPQQQAQYSPYQPQAGNYQQPYVPQAATAQGVPPAIPQVPFQPGAPQPFQQPQQFFPHQQQQQQHRQNRQHTPHHASPQQFPPAKRQRFDGPNQHRGPPPPPPQFQAPPPPPMQQPGAYGQGPIQGPYGRGGGPQSGGRGGYQGGRGGNMSTRARGGSMTMIRGTSRGRGGGGYNNMGGRGGGNQGGGSFRGQGSTRGFNNNRDNRRGGGSFNNNQGYSHNQQHQQHQQQNYHNNNNHQNQSHTSYRGRGQGYNNYSNRGGRHDSTSTSGRDNLSTTSGSFSTGKRDENKRTLTDFKIVGLKIPDLNWIWGISPEAVDPAVKDESKVTPAPSDAPPAVPPSDGTVPATAEGASTGVDIAAVVAAAPASTPAAPDASSVKAEIEALLPPPPSRIRMYFHTPVSPDDAHPISQSSYGSSVPNARKGKRKKLEDDDGDYEEGRGAPPPPPHGSGLDTGGDYDGAGRDSVAPSVAETTSEGDWLMAAIGEEEGDGDGAENLHVSEVEHFLDNGDADDGDFGNEYMQGDGNDGEQAMGDEDAQGSEVGPDDEHYTSYNVHAPHDHAEHPLVNGKGYADTPLGSQERSEGGAVASAPQNNSNQTSQETISSTPPVHASGKDVPSSDPSSFTVPAAPSSQNAGSSTDAAQSVPRSSAVPLHAMDSLASTVPDTNEENAQASPYASTVIEDGDGAEPQDYEATQPATHFGDEHAYGGENAGAPGGSSVTNVLGEKVPSANRLSVSYAGATRRLVIDAEIVPKFKVFRAEGRIEVTISLMSDERGSFKGIAMEGCSEESTYISLDLNEQLEGDPTVPPLWRAKIPSEIQLHLYLDKEKPLSEPRWVKTGDVQEWLRSMFGRMFWVAGDAADGWEKRVEVVDPDPAPTIWTVLESWASNSNVGQLNERQRFLRTHMAETDNILEILLRLVRGERSTFTQNAPINPPSISGPLLSALSPISAHGAQQTHVSLAVLAIFRLTVDYAKKAAGDKGKAEAEERVGEIIRSLPSHLIYKSLDGIFKEWRVEKKGSRPPA
ncbi:hypothetical protein C8Q80DRAFT_1230574 [Daedaleopsis nitida]|nr:hypothetical protein C8Q80DRAFT_1230574 [Daedaleopsis nitida]